MRVVVADDVMLTREGIARLLTDAGVDVAAEVGDAAALLRAVRTTQPDAAIVDIRMPPTHTDEGLVAAQQIRTEHPGVSVLILSQYVEPHYAMRLLEEHPERVGYLLKERVFDVANLIDALRRLIDGETVVDPTIVARLFARKRRADPLEELSGREREVLTLVAEGLSNRAIAARLFVTERTVEAHVKQIFQKLSLNADAGSHRRVLAVLAYLRSMPLPAVLFPDQTGPHGLDTFRLPVRASGLARSADAYPFSASGPGHVVGCLSGQGEVLLFPADGHARHAYDPAIPATANSPTAKSVIRAVTADHLLHDHPMGCLRELTLKAAKRARIGVSLA